MILETFQSKHKNQYITWIHYEKDFNTVPKKWVLKVRKDIHNSDNIRINDMLKWITLTSYKSMKMAFSKLII